MSQYERKERVGIGQKILGMDLVDMVWGNWEELMEVDSGWDGAGRRMWIIENEKWIAGLGEVDRWIEGSGWIRESEWMDCVNWSDENIMKNFYFDNYVYY